MTVQRRVASEPVIVANDLSREFRRADGQEVKALSHVNFAIERGQFVCILGPSGCGKSTLLQMIAGLLLPTSGTISVHGVPVTRPGPDRGMVFQKDSVFPWMRVIANVEYGLRCRGVPAEERRRTAALYLDRVGLSHVAQAWPRELSGGMLKRVAVATVFANGADVLLLDEPFSAVDYVTKHLLHDVLLRLWAEPERDSRRTVVFVTHDVDEALILADRILVMGGGDIVDDRTVEAQRPRSTDSLLEPAMIKNKHILLGYLGLGRSPADRQAVATGP